MKKILRIFKYILVNGFFSYSLYAGFVLNNPGFKNVGLFMAWFTIIASIIFYIVRNEKEPKRLLKLFFNQYPIPAKIDHIFDVIISLFLIYHGSFITGCLYFIHILVTISTRTTVLGEEEHERKNSKLD